MNLVEKKIIKNVAFLTPSSFLKEEQVDEVETRDVDGMKIPDDCFAFYFFDIIKATFDIEGQRIVTSSGEFNHSNRFYINAKRMTQEEVLKDYGEGSTLYRNILCSNYDSVVKCRTGNIQPFEKGDVIIEV